MCWALGAGWWGGWGRGGFLVLGGDGLEGTGGKKSERGGRGGGEKWLHVTWRRTGD